MKLRLKHIGAISLGKIAGIWGFIIAELIVMGISLLMFLAAILGSSYDGGDGIAGSVMFFIMGSIGALGYSIGMFILGALTGFIYTIILKVGGGLELEFEEIRK